MRMHGGLLTLKMTGRGDVTGTPGQPMATTSMDNGKPLQSWWWLKGISLIGAVNGSCWLRKRLREKLAF